MTIKMKLSLALCVAICFAGVQCDANSNLEDMRYLKDCATQNNMNQKMFEDLAKSKDITINQNMMCYIHCVWEHTGVFDKDGKLTKKYETIYHYTDCQNRSGRDKCETSAKILDCIMQKLGLTISEIAI